MKVFKTIILTLLLSTPYSQANASARYLIQGPLVGSTTSHSSKIWFGRDLPQKVNLVISKTVNFREKRTITVDQFYMGHITIDKLSPSTQYYYYSHFKHGRDPKDHFNMPTETYSFTTAPNQGTPTKLRFMFSSCSGPRAVSEAKSWEAISNLKGIQMMIQLGDNHYGDTTNAKAHDLQYLARRTSAPYISATANCPTYAIWDDHDFGPNNSHGQTPGKEQSLHAFKKHWANPSYGEPGNPGCYYTYHYGDIQFIMLDNRYHRDPEKSKSADDPTKTMLGKKQLAWLKQQLLSKSKFKIIGCGSEFQLKTTSDCFSGYRHEQKLLLDLFKETENVILITGDRHFVASYHNRGETIEITSGPLGSHNFPVPKSPDLFLAETPGKQFCILEIDTTNAKPTADLEVHRVGEGVIRKLHFTYNQINGHQAIPKTK